LKAFILAIDSFSADSVMDSAVLSRLGFDLTRIMNFTRDSLVEDETVYYVVK
jgi:hypothetical protein